MGTGSRATIAKWSRTLYSTRGEGRVAAAEAKGVAGQVLDLSIATAGRDHVEVAGRVLIDQVGGARQVAALQCERADGRFDRAGRAEGMTVQSLRPADRDSLRMGT